MHSLSDDEESTRLRELHSYDLLDTAPEPAFDRLTALAARLFGAPIALISLVDADRTWLKSASGMERCEVPRETSFCAHVVQEDEVLVVLDALLDSRFVGVPAVADPTGIRFYAGAPLVTPQGRRLGSVCVVDFKPRSQLTANEVATLRDLASLTVSEIELRRHRQDLRGQVDRRTDEFHAANAALNAEVAERKRAEAALMESNFLTHAIFRGATDAVYVKDLEGRYLMINPAGALAVGQEVEEIVGKDDTALFDAATARQVVARDRSIIASGASCRYETISRRADGVAQCYLSVKSPLRDHQGHVIGLIGISHDITELHATQEMLRAAKEEAERANHAKSEFLSRMSHELRTPMNAILGFSQVMELDAGLAAAHRCAVEQIYKAGRHLLGLIDEVLDISRIETGDLRLDLRPVELGSLLRECVALVTPLADSRGITWENGCLKHERWVMADPQRVRQVFINLLTNAVKYNRPSGRVRLDCPPPEGEGSDRICVRVSDTGPGISQENLARLFTPFERLDAEHSGVEGTGLGLALSRRLVESMGGKMRVESVVGQGSAFTVELPGLGGDGPFVGQTAGAAGTGFPAGRTPAALCAEPQSKTHTVLYVEDNASNLDLMRRIFSMRPALRLVSAANGQSGLEEARAQRPALILLDVQLPDLSGDEVMARLRLDPTTAEIPIVVISADAMPGQIARLLKAGARKYMTKPIEVAEVLSLLDAEFKNTGAGRN